MECKCHKAYDAGHDWWRCETHGRVTKTEYEDEYDVSDAKPDTTTKKARPVAKTAAKKARPAAKSEDKKERPGTETGDDGAEDDDLGAPPDKEPGETSGPDTPDQGKPKGFGWG